MQAKSGTGPLRNSECSSGRTATPPAIPSGHCRCSQHSIPRGSGVRLSPPVYVPPEAVLTWITAPVTGWDCCSPTVYFGHRQCRDNKKASILMFLPETSEKTASLPLPFKTASYTLAAELQRRMVRHRRTERFSLLSKPAFQSHSFVTRQKGSHNRTGTAAEGRQRDEHGDHKCESIPASRPDLSHNGRR